MLEFYCSNVYYQTTYCKLQLVFNFMRITHTTKGHGQHLPIFLLLFVNLRYRKLRYCIISTHISC